MRTRLPGRMRGSSPPTLRNLRVPSGLQRITMPPTSSMWAASNTRYGVGAVGAGFARDQVADRVDGELVDVRGQPLAQYGPDLPPPARPRRGRRRVFAVGRPCQASPISPIFQAACAALIRLDRRAPAPASRPAAGRPVSAASLALRSMSLSATDSAGVCMLRIGVEISAVGMPAARDLHRPSVRPGVARQDFVGEGDLVGPARAPTRTSLSLGCRFGPIPMAGPASIGSDSSGSAPGCSA